MKAGIGLFIFVLAFTPACAQQYAYQLWHDGKIILDTGDTLRGLVKYNIDNDLVQLQANKNMETLTARKIISFEIFDATIKRYRQFYTLPYAMKGQYKAPVFFELLAEGKMTLLAREALELKTYTSGYGYYSYSRMVLVNKYFSLKEDGTIVPLSGKKNDILGGMGAHRDEVESYMKENKLDFDKKYDLARIVEYYNSFFKR